MYIKRIRLHNFKAFEDMVIDLKPGINLLIGDNGTGKTSVLDGIVTALGALFSNIEGVTTRNISKDNVRVVVHALGDSSSSISYCEPVSAGCDLYMDKQSFSWDRTKEELSSRNTIINDRSICRWMKEITNSPDTLLPLISYQSAARVWKTKRGDFGTELQKRLDDRRCGYIGCLESSMDVKSIQQWCIKQEVASLKKAKTTQEYESFKHIVAGFLKEISGLDQMPELYYSVQFGEFVYKDKDEEMAVSRLSAGYQSLLWMIMDLSYRAVLLNPHMESAEELTGIVLIDEIDMHLHPKWQWNIINALKRTFPKVQFVATTHAPIVISSAQNANIIMLDDNKSSSYLTDAYGYTVEDILRFRQGTGARPPKVESLLKQVEDAIDEKEFAKAEKLLNDLKEELGESNSEMRKMKQIMDDAKFISAL